MDLSVCIPCLNRSRMKWQGGMLYPLPVTVALLAQALSSLELNAQIIVADYASTDWPLGEWIAAFADPVPGIVAKGNTPFTVGGGKNKAAEFADAPVLFFCETDMSVPAAVIRRGLDVAGEGRGYFPLYRRQRMVGSTEYAWGNGHGICIVRREHWLQNKWLEAQGWAADEDTRFSQWFRNRGLLVREQVPQLIHRWHPLVPDKSALDEVTAPSGVEWKSP